MNREHVRLAVLNSEVARRFRLMARRLARFIPTDGAEESFYRASGDCECSVCGLPYIEHPQHRDNGLVILCDGDWVKL